MVTDVAGQPIIPILKGQAIRQEDCSALEDGTDWLSRNVGSKLQTQAA